MSKSAVTLRRDRYLTPPKNKQTKKQTTTIIQRVLVMLLSCAWGLSGLHMLTTLSHYNEVIMDAMTSQITSLTIFTQPFIQAWIKENIKAPRHWPLCGEFTGDRRIPRTNGQ